jgi:hypothetical protein
MVTIFPGRVLDRSRRPTASDTTTTASNLDNTTQSRIPIPRSIIELKYQE